MRLALCILTVTAATAALAGTQVLWWDAPAGPVAAYEFRFGTNSGGTELTRTVAAGTNSATFTLPAGHWYVRAVSLTASNGVSDPSNEAVFDIPAPITIRLNLSSADDPEGPWSDDTNSPTVTVFTTRSKRFYRSRAEILTP